MSIIHKDIVGHPDGNLFAVERIDGVAAGGNTMLLDLADVTDLFGFALLGDELIDFGAQIRVAGGEIVDDGMLGASCTEVAPKMVSTRVVKTLMVPPAGPKPVWGAE